VWACALWLGCGAPRTQERRAPREVAQSETAKAEAAASSASATTTSPPVAEPPAPAPEPLDETAQLLALSPSHSTSVGAPGNGQLLSGVALPRRGPGYRHNDKRPADARYGTVELVQAIAVAAAAVQADLPGSGLTVNDLSLPVGGPIAQHGSHQNGRDADILFYVTDAHGAPAPSVGVPIEPDGSGVDYNVLADGEDDIHLRLDAPRTWRFMAALVEALGDQLQRIFVVEHVRSMLLAQAARDGTPQAIVARFEDVSCQPSTPHDDHMHVRLFCSPEDMGQGCLDKPPTYPFRIEALAALGLSPILERVTDRRERAAAVAARTTTPEQAAKRAGPMHREVRKFLTRRKAWLKQPHPGRPFCK
jgi:penicillin-insensitive murein endopeptidase